jgi:beta-fructofuranosidase
VTGPRTDDPLFPVLHTRPDRNWINDPNGLCVHQGRWHVFAQYEPEGTRPRHVCWWHSDSDDLLHFTDRGVVLRPSRDDNRADRDGIWSGNAVSHDGGIVAFYSAFDDREPWQPVMAATSSDGQTFVPGDAVIATAPASIDLDGDSYTVHTFRDPFVVSDGVRGWRLFVGAGLESAGGHRVAAVLEYAALQPGGPYTFLGLLHHREAAANGSAIDGETPLDTGEMWECPAYARMIDFGSGADVDLLIVSAWHRNGPWAAPVAMLSRPGSFAAGEASARLLDDGDALYAPSLVTGPDGRVLLWGWVQEKRDADELAEAGWAGSLSFPRELTVVGGDVHVHPAYELDALRAERLTPPTGALSGKAFTAGPAVDLLLTATRAEAGEVALRLTSGPVTLQVTADPAIGTAHVAEHEVMLCRSADTELRLRIMLDGSVLEAFTGAGRSVTARTYPPGHRGWEVVPELGSGWRLDCWNQAL